MKPIYSCDICGHTEASTESMTAHEVLCAARQRELAESAERLRRAREADEQKKAETHGAIFVDAIRRVWRQTGLTEEIIDGLRQIFQHPAKILASLQGLALVHPPKRMTAGSVGWDLIADIPEPVYVSSSSVVRIPTGLTVSIPLGWEGQVRIRSSLSMAGVILVNGVGTIDQDYRGVIHVPLLALCGDYMVKPGERIAQIVISPVWQGELDTVDAEQLPPTPRGAGGFGSTGRM